jgi:hypothetical protein
LTSKSNPINSGIHKMRKFTIFTALILMLGAFVASAEVAAPYQNPTYIPTFTQPSIALPTGAQNLVMSTFGSATLAGKFSGTCTGLAATAQGSVDNGATWIALNAYTYPAIGTAAPTVAAAGAITTTLFKVNVTGFNKVQIAVTALSAACSFAAVETSGDFSGVAF